MTVMWSCWVLFYTLKTTLVSLDLGMIAITTIVIVIVITRLSRIIRVFPIHLDGILTTEQRDYVLQYGPRSIPTVGDITTRCSRSVFVGGGCKAGCETDYPNGFCSKGATAVGFGW